MANQMGPFTEGWLSHTSRIGTPQVLCGLFGCFFFAHRRNIGTWNNRARLYRYGTVKLSASTARRTKHLAKVAEDLDDTLLRR
jgi:hypothetical protein